MIFPTDLKYIAKLDGLSNASIKDMPQLYRADFDFAWGRNKFLDQILRSIPPHPEFKYCSIDTRSHMLMKGMYPCIPGWHCDDFYRPDKESQPGLANVLKEAPAIHYMVILGDCSKTEFPTVNLTLPDTSEVVAKFGPEKPLYLTYDELIAENITTRSVEPETLYSFGPLCFHRGQAATHNGWRYFARITLSNHREPKNEIRYQTQVYTLGRVSW